MALPRSVALIVAALLFSGCPAKKKDGLPDLSQATPEETLPVAAALELELTHLFAISDETGAILIAARRGGGHLIHARLSERGFKVEEVIPDALPGRPALATSAAGAPTIAVITAPTLGEHARIPPPPEAPKGAVPGEGALRLLHRRGENLWRGELLADRALKPQLSVASDGTLHLVFLQPYDRGLFQVVHARVRGSQLSREVVGLGREAAPSLVLREDQPWIAHLDARGALVVRIGQAGGGYANFPGSVGKRPTVLAFDLALEKGEVRLALLTADPETPSGPVQLTSKRLKNPVPPRDSLGESDRLGTIPRAKVGELSLGREGRWLLQVPGEAFRERGPKRGVGRLAGLRELNLLHPVGPGSPAVIGLDEQGKLRVSPP